MRRVGAVVLVALLTAACSGGDSDIGAGGPGSVPRVRLVKVASLDQPLALATRPGDPTLYVAEKGGLVVAIRHGVVSKTPVLDLRRSVSLGGEQGLLGVTFSPDGKSLYVDYTDTGGDTRVAQYDFRDGRAVRSTRRELLFVDQPFSNHNGGEVIFGPDRFLYIGLGDGGSGGDPYGNGQSLETLLGKILRIDPTPDGPSPYVVPPDNPFVGDQGARPEVWLYGVRNPWRFSFDRSTGDLWIGDVGQNAWEEVDRLAAGNDAGANLGWNRMEGSHPYNDASPPPDAVSPVYEYSHDDGGCVVTGGYVYRGRRIPALRGDYVFADFCIGRLMALVPGSGSAMLARSLGPTVNSVSSFGENSAGELFAMSLNGGLYRIAPAS